MGYILVNSNKVKALSLSKLLFIPPALCIQARYALTCSRENKLLEENCIQFYFLCNTNIFQIFVTKPWEYWSLYNNPITINFCRLTLILYIWYDVEGKLLYENIWILTCCKGQCLVSKYGLMEHEACWHPHILRHPTSVYSHTNTGMNAWEKEKRKI